jgi:hypothetical protein
MPSSSRRYGIIFLGRHTTSLNADGEWKKRPSQSSTALARLGSRGLRLPRKYDKSGHDLASVLLAYKMDYGNRTRLSSRKL